jgi:endonuclease YncB( thermonuclease family)
VVGLLVPLVLVAACGVSTADPADDAAIEPVDPPEATVGPASDEDRGSTSTTAAEPSTTATPSTTAAPTTAAPSSVPSTVAPGTVRVLSVVDGDTIDVERFGRIRLIGIDAPERGACGHAEATAVLAWMVQGRQVTLVPGARDDADRYGRLLRYVEVDGVDANLEMIRSGRAVARYDSRDGYGRHPREDVYVRADAVTPDANACAPPTTLGFAPAAPPAGGGTDPRLRTCRDVIAAGLGPYRRGVHPEYDWYRDADGDGVVCER